MKRLLAVLAPAVLIAALVAGCGSSSSASSSDPSSSATTTGGGATQTSAATVVKAAEVGKLGTVLTDAKGRTLYLFVPDKGPKSTCYDSCATEWPPLTTGGKPSAGAGVKAAMLTTTKRKDGTSQVDYAGHPLYYFVGDTSAGATSGQGLDDSGGLWWAVAPNGKQVTTGGAKGDGGS